MTGSMGDVVAVVRAAIDAYTRIRRDLRTHIDKTNQAIDRLTAATTGSAHPGPTDARRTLDRSRTELEESAAHADEAVRRLMAYLASLEGGGGAGGAPTSSPRPPLGPGSRTTEKPFNVRTYLDDLPYMPPRRERRRGGKPHKTHGRWVGTDEGPQPDTTSGEDSPFAHQAQRLWERLRDKSTDPKILPIRGHYETKFAMFMRQESRTEEHIVINNPDGPCGYGLENYRFGCDRLLPVLLPQDAKLTVDWPDGRTTYTGARDS